MRKRSSLVQVYVTAGQTCNHNTNTQQHSLGKINPRSLWIIHKTIVFSLVSHKPKQVPKQWQNRCLSKKVGTITLHYCTLLHVNSISLSLFLFVCVCVLAKNINQKRKKKTAFWQPQTTPCMSWMSTRNNTFIHPSYCMATKIHFKITPKGLSD